MALYVRIHAGIANQIFDFIGAYIISKETGINLTLIVDESSENVQAEYILDNLNIPTYPKIVVLRSKFDGDLRWCIPKKILMSSTIISANKGTAAESEKYNLEAIYCENIKDAIAIIKENRFNNFLMLEFWQKFGTVFSENLFYKYLNDFIKMITIKESSKLKVHISNVDFDKAVLIHCRVGYLPSQYRTDEIASKYMAAIMWYRKKIEGALFFVVSDNIDWCIEKFGISEDIRYVYTLGGFDRDIDTLMFICQFKYRFFLDGSTYRLLSHYLQTDNNKERLYLCNNGRKIIYNIAAVFKTYLCDRHNGKYSFIENKEYFKLADEYRKNRNEYERIEHNIQYNKTKLLSADVSREHSAEEFLNYLGAFLTNAGILTKDDINILAIKTIVALKNVGEVTNSLMMARRYRFDLINQEEFIAIYIELLINKRNNKLACIEIARSGLDYNRLGWREKLSNEDVVDIKELRAVKRKTYILCCTRERMSMQFLTEMVQLGEYLRRLNNKVIFVYRTTDYKVCFDSNRFMDVTFVDYDIEQYSWSEFLEKRLKMLEHANDDVVIVYRSKFFSDALNKLPFRRIFWDPNESWDGVDNYDDILIAKVSAIESINDYDIRYLRKETYETNERLTFDTFYSDNMYIYEVLKRLIVM